MRVRSVIVGVSSVVLAAILTWLSVRPKHQRFQYYSSGLDAELPGKLAGTGYVQHTIETPDGAVLQGVVRPPATKDGPWLVMFPGNAERQLVPSLGILEDMRAGQAAGAAVFAYRGYDGSTGVPSVTAAEQDVRSVLAHLEAHFGANPRQFVLIGYSMGSGLALRGAAERSARGQAPRALVVLSPYWSLEIAPARPWNALWSSDVYRVDDVVPQLRPPVLIVGALRDDALPVAQHARRLAAALGTRAEYWELPEAGHHDYLQDSQLLARVGQFGLRHAEP
jgi:pimeloyl-ACP methyl ester carboxylesterase